MYIPSKIFANSRFDKSVLITEYFPLSKDTQLGTVIPMYNNGAISKLFIDVVTRQQGIEVRRGPNTQPLLSKEHYVNDLNSLIKRMTTLHNNAVTFTTKDIDIMYETYRALHGNVYVAGLVSIATGDTLSLVEDNDNVPIPPEGVMIGIGFETYVASLRRNLPFLVLDYYTASHMYKLYWDKIGVNAQPEDIGFLIDCPGVQQLSSAVFACAPDLTANDLNMFVEEEFPEQRLSGYFTQMQMRYGLREKIARSLLLYHPAIVQRTLSAAKERLGIFMDNSETIWVESSHRGSSVASAARTDITLF